MGFEYDWLVLGDSEGAVHSASLAARWGARVAWVVPPGETWRSRVCGELAIAQLQHSSSTVDLAENWRLAEEITENLAILRSPATLALQGVDVHVGSVEFRREPHLRVRLHEAGELGSQRELRSRHYLLAPAPQAHIPPIQGLQEIPYYDLNHLKPLLSGPLPQHLTIVGADPQGAVLAQTLARLGVSVQLLVAEPLLLPHEDPDLGQRLHAELEAAGVQVLTGTPLMQVREIEGQIWFQGGNQARETEGLVLAQGWQGHLQGIGVDKLLLKWYDGRIGTSPRLETAQEGVYACGSLLGGYCDRELERYEAELATYNALVLPRDRLDYSSLPRIISTDPPIAAVGLTTPQARQRFGEEFVTLSLPLYQVDSCQRRGQLDGLAKLLVRPSGQIIGAHSFADEAPHWIQAIAVLMKQRSHIRHLAMVPPPDRDLFDGFLRLWYQVWRQRHPQLHRLQQAWFDERR